MTSLDQPFFDLFQRLQAAGMPLSPEQYDWLRQAVNQGLGLDNWDRDWSDLRELCRVLWVKPHPNYDAQLFDRIFQQYVQEKRREIQLLHEPKPTKPPKQQPSGRVERRLPMIPPRRMPMPQSEESLPKAPVAVKTTADGLPKVDETGLHLTPRQLPLTTRSVLDIWQFLRRPKREGLDVELDFDATVDCINQAGFFSDVVMRPVLSKKTDLVLLIDDSNVMLPFYPALEPLGTAILDRQITPATLYRFTTYPDYYLYDWQHPSRAVPLAAVLSRMHPRRTVVMVWSTAGATSLTVNAEHQRGILKFLTRLSPCLRDLIWLNPLPSQRWQGTLAEDLALRLDGRMIHVDASRLLALAKQPTMADRFYLRALG